MNSSAIVEDNFIAQMIAHNNKRHHNSRRRYCSNQHHNASNQHHNDSQNDYCEDYHGDQNTVNDGICDASNTSAARVNDAILCDD